MNKISFKNSAGIELVGVLHVPDIATTKIVIICHGFTSNKDRPRHIRFAEALAASGVAAFRLDFGGSGESEDREITLAAQVDDLQTAIAYLHSAPRPNYTEFGVLGESLGGLTALEAYDDHVKAMVLWAPVTKARWTSELTKEQEKSLSEHGYYIRKKDGKDFRIPATYVKERNGVDQEKLLSRIRIPILIVHGATDTMIPIRDSEEAVHLLPEGSRLEVVENWEHGDQKMEEGMDTIIPTTVNWFVSRLAG